MTLADRIIEHFGTFAQGCGNKVPPKAHKRRNPQLWADTLAATEFLEESAAPNQRFWHILHEVWYRPHCRYNGKPLVWFHGCYRQTSGKGSNNRMPYNKQKVKATCIERYGVDNPAKHQDVRAKMAATNLARYGHENFFGSPQGIQLVKDFWADPIHRQKRLTSIREAFFAKFGGYPYQDEAIFHKAMRNGFKLKPFTFPSGRTEQVQGYEPLVLTQLLEMGYSEEDLLVGRSRVPEVWYEFEGTRRRYYPDIFIPSERKIVEVKSDFSFAYQLHKNLAKQAACESQGYQFEFVILSGLDAKNIAHSEQAVV